jgi:hypothetical protein
MLWNKSGTLSLLRPFEIMITRFCYFLSNLQRNVNVASENVTNFIAVEATMQLRQVYIHTVNTINYTASS